MTNRDHPYIEPDGLQTPESIQCERKHVQEKPPGRQPMKRLLSEKKLLSSTCKTLTILFVHVINYPSLYDLEM